jgi:hypothetical protein
MASKCSAEGIKGLIQLLRRAFRKGTAELTYRNRDMGFKLGRLNLSLVDRGSCAVISGRVATPISTVLLDIPTEFLLVISCISARQW